jgi:7,8-dihydropterin-6-yl-methyl-4-(beta-D-ribofuranosyl)aminobenzene 5'-phosphate synthase
MNLKALMDDLITVWGLMFWGFGMDFKFVCNNRSSLNGFKTGWGFAVVIEGNGNTILFDAGWDGNLLLSNMKLAGVNPESIQKLVLSHQDWDHIGGVNHILDYNSVKKIYVPRSFSKNLKDELGRYSDLVEVSDPLKICDGIYTTGELGTGSKVEQSLMIGTRKGMVVLTGCAHPGLENILKTAGTFGKIFGVIGGFHKISDMNVFKGIRMVMPCHCTEHVEDIKRAFPEAYRECADIHIE